MRKNQAKMARRNRTMERACDKAILQTLNYRAVFKAGVSKQQLGTYIVSKKKLDLKTLDKRIDALAKSKKIRVKAGKYYVTKKPPLSWNLRAGYSAKHLRDAKKAAALLSVVPWIKMLAVTGAVAAYNAKKSDDIDVFIITEKNRLWLTRLFVVLLLKSVGKYRTDKDYNGKVCPNIYLDERYLEWPEEKRNLFTAHEILMMHPLIDRDDTYFRFVGKNAWLLKYFANAYFTVPTKIRKKSVYGSRLVDHLEELLFGMQVRYMKRRKTTENVSKKIIHFNKHDHTEGILSKYKELSK